MRVLPSPLACAAARHHERHDARHHGLAGEVAAKDAVRRIDGQRIRESAVGILCAGYYVEEIVHAANLSNNDLRDSPFGHYAPLDACLACVPDVAGLAPFCIYLGRVSPAGLTM